MRDGRLVQLSDDQTLHAQLVRDGVMSPEDAGKGAGSNVILQALGTRLDVEPTIWTDGLPLRLGDIAVMCSDGLTNHVNDAEISNILNRKGKAQTKANALIKLTNARGGKDNTTLIIAQYQEDK